MFRQIDKEPIKVNELLDTRLSDDEDLLAIPLDDYNSTPVKTIAISEEGSDKRLDVRDWQKFNETTPSSTTNGTAYRKRNLISTPNTSKVTVF